MNEQDVASAAESPPRVARARLVLAGVLVVTTPAVTLATVYALLTATRSAVVRQLTPVEVVELYLVELVAFAAFSYLLYRLMRHTVEREVAAGESVDARPDGDPHDRHGGRHDGEADRGGAPESRSIRSRAR